MRRISFTGSKGVDGAFGGPETDFGYLSGTDLAMSFLAAAAYRIRNKELEATSCKNLNKSPGSRHGLRHYVKPVAATPL